MSSTQSAEQTLQDMMWQYCDWRSSVYPDMEALREVLTQLSDHQKLHILQQKYSGRGTPLDCAAGEGDTEIIRTLLTSLQSSADRLKLLTAGKYSTPLHRAAHYGRTESVKMILDSLTPDQQIQLMSVRGGVGETAIQWAEGRRRTDTARVLREYQHRADNLMQRRRQEQQRINDEKTRQRLSGINAQSIIAAVVICYMIIPLQGLHGNRNVEKIHNFFDV